MQKMMTNFYKADIEVYPNLISCKVKALSSKEAKRTDATPILPDDKSGRLALSKEQIGRFTW